MQLFKRIALLQALMFLEIFIFIIFILFYTELLWVSWDSTKAIYTVLAIIPIFLLTLFTYLKTRKVLSNITNRTTTVEATLINKKKINLVQRKVFIWTYEYKVNKITYKKTYWSTVNIRDLESGESFQLAVDPQNHEKNYFPHYDYSPSE